MRKCLVNVNERLPEDFRLLNPTGHAGRSTACTIAAGMNVPIEVIAMTSKHRDSNTLRGYVRPGDGLLMATALTVGAAAAQSRKRKGLIAGVLLAGKPIQLAPSLRKNLAQRLLMHF